MKKTITIDNTKIEYNIRKHARAKQLKLSVSAYGDVRVTVPKYVPIKLVTPFIHLHKSWLLDKLKKAQYIPKPKKLTKEEVVELKIKTREMVRTKLEKFNRYYNFEYLRITVRNQKTRWGSCSSNKTLSFNCKLALLPEEMVDYIVVHELCHLREMNHSKRFWDLVAQTIPNHRAIRKRLHREGLKLQ